MSSSISAQDINEYKPLLIGRERQLISLLRSSLNTIKCGQVYSAHDGIQALRLLEQNTPNMLVVCDDLSGNITSEELVRYIRDPAKPDICTMPILYVISKPTQSNVLRAMAIGVSEAIPIPFSRGDFLDRFQASAKGREFVQSGQYFGPHRPNIAVDEKPAAS